MIEPETCNWIEYNTYGNTPLVYITFCLMLFFSFFVLFFLFKATIVRKKEIKDPKVNTSYSLISLRIITWC